MKKNILYTFATLGFCSVLMGYALRKTLEWATSNKKRTPIPIGTRQKPCKCTSCLHFPMRQSAKPIR